MQGKQLSAGGKAEKVETGGPNSGLILAGLAAVAVVGVAVSSQNTSGETGGAPGSGSAPSTGGVQDDIAARKKDAKQWIANWKSGDFELAHWLLNFECWDPKGLCSVAGRDVQAGRRGAEVPRRVGARPSPGMSRTTLPPASRRPSSGLRNGGRRPAASREMKGAFVERIYVLFGSGRMPDYFFAFACRCFGC